MIDQADAIALSVIGALLVGAFVFCLRKAYLLGKAAAVRELFPVLRSSDVLRTRI